LLIHKKNEILCLKKEVYLDYFRCKEGLCLISRDM